MGRARWVDNETAGASSGGDGDGDVGKGGDGACSWVLEGSKGEGKRGRRGWTARRSQYGLNGKWKDFDWQRFRSPIKKMQPTERMRAAREGRAGKTAGSHVRKVRRDGVDASTTKGDRYYYKIRAKEASAI